VIESVTLALPCGVVLVVMRTLPWKVGGRSGIAVGSRIPRMSRSALLAPARSTSNHVSVGEYPSVAAVTPSNLNSSVPSVVDVSVWTSVR
jgi:hypothetical protein